MAKALNFMRAVSSEGFGRIRYDLTVRRLLKSDPSVRRFLETGSASVPQFYMDQIRRDLGPWWHELPDGALHHDCNAYLGVREETMGSGKWAAAPTTAIEPFSAGLLAPSPSSPEVG
jgi:hypothetical protein